MSGSRSLTSSKLGLVISFCGDKSVASGLTLGDFLFWYKELKSLWILFTSSMFINKVPFFIPDNAVSLLDDLVFFTIFDTASRKLHKFFLLILEFSIPPNSLQA